MFFLYLIYWKPIRKKIKNIISIIRKTKIGVLEAYFWTFRVPQLYKVENDLEFSIYYFV